MRTFNAAEPVLTVVVDAITNLGGVLSAEYEPVDRGAFIYLDNGTTIVIARDTDGTYMTFVTSDVVRGNALSLTPIEDSFNVTEPNPVDHELFAAALGSVAATL